MQWKTYVVMSLQGHRTNLNLLYFDLIYANDCPWESYWQHVVIDSCDGFGQNKGQAITWTNGDWFLLRHMALLGHEKLRQSSEEIWMVTYLIQPAILWFDQLAAFQVPSGSNMA